MILPKVILCSTVVGGHPGLNTLRWYPYYRGSRRNLGPWSHDPSQFKIFAPGTNAAIDLSEIRIMSCGTVVSQEDNKQNTTGVPATNVNQKYRSINRIKQEQRQRQQDFLLFPYDITCISTESLAKTGVATASRFGEPMATGDELTREFLFKLTISFQILGLRS